MSIVTPWGYTVSSLGTILTDAEFQQMTAGKFTGDVRISSEIAAATSGVRSECGWHVAPSETCTLTTRAHDKRLIYSGCDTIIQLPATFVTAVESVEVGGEAVTDYSFETGGLLRIYDRHIDSRKTTVEVVYTAGLQDELAGSIKELLAYRVIHGLSQSYGITSEAAGGVSVTYNAAWVNGGSVAHMSDTDAEVLAPYRLRGVF